MLVHRKLEIKYVQKILINKYDFYYWSYVSDLKKKILVFIPKTNSIY